MQSIHKITPSIHRVTPSIHRITPSVHRMARSIHMITPSIHRIARSIHRIAQSVNRMALHYRSMPKSRRMTISSANQLHRGVHSGNLIILLEQNTRLPRACMVYLIKSGQLGFGVC